MKTKSLLISLSILLLAALPATAPAQAVVAMLVDDTPGYTMDDDEQAAYNWFKANYVDKGTGKFINLEEINTDPSSTPTALEGIKAIWVCIDRDNENDFTENIPDRYNWENIKDNLRNWYKAGGNLLLTNHATVYAERLGRISVKPNTRGYSAGSDNTATWAINITPETKDRSTHPLFKRLPIWKKTDANNILEVDLQSGNYKEDHNCLWNEATVGENNAAFELAHNATVLASWGHDYVERCAGIVEFNPTSEYKGKAIAIGVAAYEWRTNQGTNEHQANIERMTANALAYLAPSLNKGEVAYLIDNTLYRTDETSDTKLDDDEIASWQWFEQTYADKGCVISCQDIEDDRVDLNNFNTLWIAIDRPGLTRGATNLPTDFITDKVKNAVTDFYKAGGNLLLTNHATQYLALTGRVRDFQDGDAFESNAINNNTNNDIWDIRTNVRQDDGVCIDRSGHPLYVGLEVFDEEGKYIHLMNASKREDFNCFWVHTPITSFQETYQCTVVGTWPDVRFDLTGIVDFRPYTHNETTYRGRAIAIGLAAYEWNANEGTNTYRGNIEKLTQNAIAYLNSKWNGSTPTGTWSEGAYKAAFADGLLDKNATSIDLRQMTGVTTVPTVEGLNPNCLVYANAGATGKNVIVNGTAAQITLSEGGNFNVPETFTAQNIQYTREFANTGWFSTTLPFVPTDLGSLQFEELANVKNTGGALSLVFSPVALPEAGKPYIVHVGTAGSQTFSATNVQVSGTTSETNGTGAVMRPCYATTSGEGKYMLKADGSAFAKGGASSTIGAFRAYIELTGSSAGAPARLVVSHTGEEGGGATNLEGTRVMQTTDGLAGIYANTEQDVLVYSANGQLIDRLHLSEGFNALTHLPKGLYLVNQQKLIIR